MDKKKSNGLLVLVRHGESIWNAKGLWTGWTDVPLSKKGQKEARDAALVLKDVKFDLLISSNLIRATQTMDIILKELKYENRSYKIIDAYKERDYGIYTGKNKWEIQKLLGEEKFNNLRRGWDVSIPKGETLKDVYNRVIPNFRINVLPLLKTGQNVMIVAHGNSHRAIIKYLEKISSANVAGIEMATGEVIIYGIDSSGNITNKEKRLINNKKGKQ